MKTAKRLTVVAICAALMVGAIIAFGACGNTVAGTYTFEALAEDCNGNMSHNGYLSASAAYQVNTLVLGEDDTYTLTKDTKTDGESGIEMKYIFTGTYTYDGNTVTLSAPTDVEWTENWSHFTNYGFVNTQGKYSEGDTTVNCKTGEAVDGSHDPRNFFNGPYYVDSTSNTSQTVTVDTENGTFSYSAS